MRHWAELVDDNSYLFHNVLPFYQRTVHFTPPNIAVRAPNSTVQYNESAFGSGRNGPLEVSYSNYAMPFSSWMKLGMKAIGINEANDFNSGSLMGFQYCSSTIRSTDQTRSSSHAAFLNELSQITHLIVYHHTLAKRILFDDGSAKGVRVATGESAYTLRANKEVIISAGAFQSPQLLLVSGIGAAETLAEYGIPVVSDLPGVGQNMCDHIYFGPTHRVRVISLARIARDLVYLISQFVEYLHHQRGPVASPVTDFLAWEKVPRPLRSHFSAQTKADLAQFPSDWPEVEVGSQLMRIIVFVWQFELLIIIICLTSISQHLAMQETSRNSCRCSPKTDMSTRRSWLHWGRPLLVEMSLLHPMTWQIYPSSIPTG